MTNDINKPTAEFIANLQTAALTPMMIGNTQHVVIPRDYQLVDRTAEVEKAQPFPARKKGTVALGDVASFPL